MASKEYNFLSSRRASFLGPSGDSEEPSKQVSDSGDADFSLSLDDLHPRRDIIPSSEQVEMDSKELALSPRSAPIPERDKIRNMEHNLPGLDREPMFSLSRVQSGIGVINLALESGGSVPPCHLLLETMDGEHIAIPRDGFYHHGISQALGGDVTLDLAFSPQWRRMGLIMGTPFQGALRISSDIFSWSKNLTIDAPAQMAIAPLLVFNVFGKTIWRQTYVSQSTMRSTAECIGFNRIQWRDPNTPLQQR